MIDPEVLLREALYDGTREVFPSTTDPDVLANMPCVIFSVDGALPLENGPWQRAFVADLSFIVCDESYDGCRYEADRLANDIESLPGFGYTEIGWVNSVELTRLPTRSPSIPGTPNGLHQMVLSARAVFIQ